MLEHPRPSFFSYSPFFFEILNLDLTVWTLEITSSFSPLTFSVLTFNLLYLFSCVTNVRFFFLFDLYFSNRFILIYK